MKIINILWTDFDQTAIQSICVYWYRIHQSPCMVQHPCNTTTTTTHSVDSLAETNTFGIAAWTSWTTESGSSLGRFVGGPTGSFWKLPQGKTSASHGLGLDKLAAQFYQVYVEQRLSSDSPIADQHMKRFFKSQSTRTMVSLGRRGQRTEHFPHELAPLSSSSFTIRPFSYLHYTMAFILDLSNPLLHVTLPWLPMEQVDVGKPLRNLDGIPKRLLC